QTVRSVTLTLAYDPSLLTITAAALASGVPADSTFTIDTTTPGQALITFHSTTGIVLAHFIDPTTAVPNPSNPGQPFLNLTASGHWPIRSSSRTWTAAAT